MFIGLLLKYYFRCPKEFVVFLGEKRQKGSLYAVVYGKQLWEKETIYKKLQSLMTFNWRPKKKVLQNAAYKILIETVFGTPEEYGDYILKTMAWHQSREWDLTALTPSDIEKSEALRSMTTLTRIQFSQQPYLHLALNIAKRSPSMVILIHPMVIKMPVVSLWHYLDLHSEYAFNAIRKANHPHSDDLISYLYDILYIQQKIAISLHDFIRTTEHAETKKKDSLLMLAEVDAIRYGDLVFTYLKASIEKTVVLLGLTHGIKNLENKKTHSAKLSALLIGMPPSVTQQAYWEFVYEFIKPEKLEELNNYRTGLLHKKGTSKLQPHQYVGTKGAATPLVEIFSILLEQHAKNTAVLLGVLAILTDELVKRDPPSDTLAKSFFDFVPSLKVEDFLKDYLIATSTESQSP